MRTAERARVRLAISVVVALFGVVVTRLTQLTVVEGDRLAGLALRQHVGHEEFVPLRGSILDRSGDPLALSIDADSIFLRPRQLPPGASSGDIVRTLGLTPRDWLRKVSSPSPFVWLKRQATPSELEAVRTLALPGVGTLPERRRFYPRGPLAAPIVGFAGIDSQGLEGVERAYDEWLRGATTAFGVERDALGRKIFSRGIEDPPRRGADVQLTLDSALQYAAERELERQVTETRARGGILLLLDPGTGEMLAAAQSPSFDPNEFGAAGPEAWRNRAVTDSYEPGSTLKALLAAAALEEGVASRGERFFCEEGNYRIGRNVIHDHHGYGWLTFEDVFRVSSNICSAKIGERLGAERYGRFLRAFGLGQRTGIDLAGEQSGIMRPAATWKPIELATVAFGQGISVTPLQLVNAYAALANGGILMRPYVVRRVVSEDGQILLENRPTMVRRVVSEATARVVTEILEGVVSSEGGTGGRAAVTGIRIAGKTGTAQKVDPVRGGYSRGRIASFVGYFPAEKPRAVMLVVVDEPRTTIWGGTAAAPVFREVTIAVSERFGLERGTPDENGGREEGRRVLLPGPLLQDAQGVSYVGLSLREALARARAEGIAVEVSGSGYVVEQKPIDGVALEPGEPLRLVLRPAGETGS